ncbi:MAG: glycosyltransferase family 4 protein [Herminiimonas sp.]|nr:glycosyltransferase family 4 protein [Herminiimonas sp.]
MMPASGIFDIVMVAAIASFTISMLIVYTQAWHGKYSLDYDLAGIQKAHKAPIPRVGGIAVVTGILVVIILSAIDDPYSVRHVDVDGLFLILLAGMPAFLAGLQEDLTKKVSVKMRLLATFTSALLACWLSGAYLSRLDIPGIDTLLGFVPIAVCVTAFAVAGVANSINIIDGFNGVAGSAVVIILTGLGFLAWEAGDVFIVYLALAGIGATLGFLAVNYPTGRLFLGDGGAYLLGYLLAEVAVLLVIRNPTINAWQVFAICAYPVIEVVFSIYRRKVIRKLSPGAPDRLHLHTLIYRRLVCQRIPVNRYRPWIRNAAVACVVASWIAMTTFMSVAFGTTISGALAVLLLQVMAYLTAYKRLVRGRWTQERTVVQPSRPVMTRSGVSLRKLP